MSATDLDDGAGVTRPEVGRIVVGVDGSESSRQALIWGRRLARLLGCEVEAVTVWQVPAVASPSAGWAPLPPDADLAGQAAAKLADTVAAAFDDDPPAELRLCVRHGHAARTLVEESVGARMLIVGTRGHGGAVGRLLGSVSSACIEQARCPVLVVPDDGPRREELAS